MKYLDNNTKESHKRLIAFMCAIALILELVPLYFVTLTDNQVKVINGINDGFMWIIFFAFFGTVAEKFKDVIKK